MTTDAQRLACVDLLRLAEPGDEILKAGVLACGAEQMLALVRSRQSEAVPQLQEACEAVGLQVPGDKLSTVHERWRMRLPSLNAVQEQRIMARLGARLIHPEDDEWPTQLTELGVHEPLALWVRGPGNLQELLTGSIALVGARASTHYGEHVAGSIAYELAMRGHTIVSGGAYGIDAASHQAALAAAETPEVGTVAFMAGGVDRYYPRGNADMLTRIGTRYAVVSETAAGQTAMRHRFLLRNRLIAAAAQATIVVEAGWRSGALNTANRAAELLRTVGAVPGPITSHASAGCHRLIREGQAVCVTSADDIAELVEPIDTTRSETEHQPALRITDEMTAEQSRTYNVLPTSRGIEAATAAVRSGLDAHTVMAALAALELSGHVEREAHGWVKKRAAVTRGATG